MHASSPLQGSLSGQGVPSAAVPTWQPVSGSHVFEVQGSMSVQTSGVPARQVPASSQTSAPLQTVASSHGVAGGSATAAQPTSTTHESAVHALPSLQTRSALSSHTPAPSQVSSPLQGSESGQGDPAVAGSFWHSSTGSHVSVVQSLRSSQFGGGPATHSCALLQVSLPLHTVSSSHGVPGVGIAPS